MISYDIPIRLKTFPNKGVSPKLILYSSTKSLFAFSLLVDNTLIELISYSTPTRLKTLPNKKVSPESILYFLTKSLFTSLFLANNTLIELIPCDAPIKLKTFPSKRVLLESILYSSIGSLFAPFKYSWNLNKKFRKSWYLIVNNSLSSLKSDHRDKPFIRFLAFL